MADHVVYIFFMTARYNKARLLSSHSTGLALTEKLQWVPLCLVAFISYLLNEMLTQIDGDCPFYILNRSHLQSQVNSVCQSTVL